MQKKILFTLLYLLCVVAISAQGVHPCDTLSKAYHYATDYWPWGVSGNGTATRTLYHVPEDTMEQIDMEIMRDVVKLRTMTVIDIANPQ